MKIEYDPEVDALYVRLIQRGNNRQACFFADEDCRFYLDWLAEHAGKTGCRIHAFVLMTNHVHLLLSAEVTAALGRRTRPGKPGRPRVAPAPASVELFGE